MTNLKIEGMTCGHCSAAVKRALEQVEGVVSVQVDLEAGHATVEGSPEFAALLAAVQEEGYSAQALA